MKKNLSLARQVRKLAYTAPLLALAACGGTAEGWVDEESAEVQQPILNGTPVANVDVHARLWTAVEPNGTIGEACSGTFVTREWVVTAKHCHAGTSAGRVTQITLGNTQRLAAQVVNHPVLDVTLVKVNSPVSSVWQTSMYPWPTANLQNQTVTCFGYGKNTVNGGSGTLRSGSMVVSQTSAAEFTVVRDANNQLSYSGDSGGGCFSNTKNPALLGVASYVRVTQQEPNNENQIVSAHYVPTSAFSQWALPIIVPGTNLPCLGRECVSNPEPLPNNVYEETAWKPCLGELSGRGSYNFDWTADYEFERNYDHFRVEADWITGSGTLSGRSSASHLGHRVNVKTDYSVNSRGLVWLRARCNGDI